ncbi:MAG: DNA polymerase IV [Promethearchaeota archaeon]
MTGTERIIVHVDLDCFFASVEVRDNPELVNRPLVIGADPKGGRGRGVVLTSSYQARSFGIHSGMAISRAYHLCPDAIYLPPDFKKYQKASFQVMNILKSCTERFQQASIDEAYLDLTGVCASFSDAYDLALQISRKIKSRVGITCSIGIAPSKKLAKIGTEVNKPNSITLVYPGRIQEIIGHLDITYIPGIGKKTRTFYYKKNLKTINDVFGYTRPQLIHLLGKHGSWLYNVVHGYEVEKARSRGLKKSLSLERTFKRDISDRKIITFYLKELNRKLHEKLTQQSLFYKNVGIKIRFSDFKTCTRSKTFPHHRRSEKFAFRVINALFDEFKKDDRKIRLIGVKFSHIHKIKSKPLEALLG